MERDAFLGRVRTAAASGRLPESSETITPVEEVPDLVDTFVASVRAVDGEVHDGDPIEALRDLVERHGPGAHLSWDRRFLPVPGAEDVLAGAGPRLDHVVPADGRRAHQAEYRAARYGLTGAEAGFAQSGTVVVRSGVGRPRLASLVPEVHVVLLPTDRIFGSLTAWSRTEAEGMVGAANVVFVTGPSRTGDIEQVLTLGVHGPRHLHVLLVEP